MTSQQLHSFSLSDLGKLATKHGVRGWQAMRKAQLVRAILRRSVRRAPARQRSGRATSKRRCVRAPRQASVARRTKAKAAEARSRSAIAAAKRRSSAVALKLRMLGARSALRKNLAVNGSSGRDRLVAMVRDPFWLEVHWDLSPRGVVRAEAALAQEWHSAKPMLRLLQVATNAVTSTTERVIRDVDIHGGVSHWFVDVQDPPQTYRLEIGYKVPSGRFFVLARSNTVTTPRAGASDEIDKKWPERGENYDKILARSSGHHGSSRTELHELLEERLRRPMSSSVFSTSSGMNGRRRGFSFELEAELIVYGATEPGANVTLQGEPIRLRSDGTFTVRYGLPNCRQLIPATAKSADGAEQRTVILAIERNTKVMEPLVRDGSEPPAAT